MEHDVGTTGRIRGALAYPAFITVIAVVLVVFMTAVIMPQLTDMFAGTGIELPITTRILVGLGTFLVSYWFLVLPGLVGAAVGVGWWMRTPAGQRVIHNVAWRAPLLRALSRKLAYARWAGTLAAMQASAVPLPEALKLARGISGNTVMRDALTVVEPMVAQGSRLSEAMRASGVFPASMVYITAIGEDNGTLDNQLERTATRYETEIDRLLEKLPQFLEPAMIVAVGFIVGVILLSFYWPLFNLYQAGGPR
jgi:type IV pilus assembly protein PilC